MKRIVPFAILMGFALIVWDYSYVRDQALTVRSTVKTVVTNVTTPVVTERVMVLPEDGRVFYTTLFLPNDWQANDSTRRLRAWFDTNRSLVSLRSQTKFSVITDADPQWNARYAATVTTLPCIALTDATGAVVYKSSGLSVPKTATALANSIAADIQKRCPNGRCPWDDEPEVAPVTPVVPDTPPAVVPEVPEKEDFPLWLGLLLGASGIGLGVGPDIVKKYKSLG